MLTTTNVNSNEFNDPIVVEKPQDKFLIIGKPSSGTGSFPAYFDDCNFALDFEEAKRYMLGNTKIPALIIINVPLVFLEFTSFRNWIRENITETIPVVYLDTQLTKPESKLLFNLHLVDDVVDANKSYSVLLYKAKFLKKISESSSIKRKELKIFPPQISCKLCFIKRSIDVLVSLIAIILLLPVFILISIAIRIESKGPIFYTANRAGRGFKVFKFFKFRTMVVDADQQVQELIDKNLYKDADGSPVFFKIEDDPRITKIGALLRNSSLDELPQLFNVLRGDMSIVGNRPLPLYEAATLTTNEWAERFIAPAGITGLWQVKKRGQKNMSAEERLQLDINYARNNSLVRDLWIMAKTPSALFQKSNV